MAAGAMLLLAKHTLLYRAADVGKENRRVHPTNGHTAGQPYRAETPISIFLLQKSTYFIYINYSSFLYSRCTNARLANVVERAWQGPGLMIVMSAVAYSAQRL